ncbi:E3 ubiquitin-protein ligase tom1 [Coemansia sp. RSA 475]|nr:E3 ubiquitin-protein ligase tom1 [Coemansia sp. RSA 475]
MPDIDVDDWRNNTEYHGGYNSSSAQIQWFWRAVRSYDQEERAKLLQFVTGTSKVPLEGFAHLQGNQSVQKFQIHKDFASPTRLPTAHTCFNQLDLPLYDSFETLKANLLLAISECSTGFGFLIQIEMSQNRPETTNELAEQARASNVEMSERVCLDMSHFKSVLRHLRKVDDNIILRMNTTNTAAAGECQIMFGVLQTAYARRDHDIEYCLRVLDRKIDERRAENTPSFSLQTQRRWLDGEHGVERIVRRRTLDVFRTRCPFFELPKEYIDILESKQR